MGNRCCTGGGASPADAPREDANGNVIGSGRLREGYTVLRLIGKGHYGLVYEGEEKSSGKKVAIKVLDRSKSRPHRLRLEVEILKTIGAHLNIVQLMDHFETEDAVELVFELMTGGELFERIVSRGPYKEARALVIVKHMTDALAHIHGLGIVHRDLKPENLLLSTKDDKGAIVKLADFGLSHLLAPGQTTMTTVCGTWAYSAPEVRISRQKYNHKVDTWSLGVIMFVLLSGYHPFDPDGDAPEEQLQRNIKYGVFDFEDPAWDSVSSSARDLIRRLLVVDPRRRYDTGDVLGHGWIVNNCHLWDPAHERYRGPLLPPASEARQATSPEGGGPSATAPSGGSAVVITSTGDAEDAAVAAAASAVASPTAGGGAAAPPPTKPPHLQSSSGSEGAPPSAVTPVAPPASGAGDLVSALVDSASRPRVATYDSEGEGGTHPSSVGVTPTAVRPRVASTSGVAATVDTEGPAATVGSRGQRLVLPPLGAATTPTAPPGGGGDKEDGTPEATPTGKPGGLLPLPSKGKIEFDAIQAAAAPGTK